MINQLIALSGNRLANVPQSYMEGATHMQNQRANELAMRKAQMELEALPEANRLANLQVRQQMRIGQQEHDIARAEEFMKSIAPIANEIADAPDFDTKKRIWQQRLPYIQEQGLKAGQEITPEFTQQDAALADAISSRYGGERYRTFMSGDQPYQREMKTGKAVAHPLAKKSPLIEQRLGGTKYVDERLKGQAQAVGELQKSAKNAYRNIENLERFIQKSDKAQQGGLQPIVSGVQNLFASFGVEFEDLTNVREMESAVNQILANYMDQLGARGLTDQDMKILQAALPRINTDRAAREQIARTLQKVYAADIDEYISIREEEKKTPELTTSVLDRSWMGKYQSMNKPWLEKPPEPGQLTYEDMLDPDKVSDEQMLQMMQNINPQQIRSIRIDERP